jgi:hypothetical protein
MQKRGGTILMKSLRLFKKRLLEGELTFTDSIHQAMYLLPDGSMIDGEFDGGMRGQDHRVIFVGVNYEDYYMSSNTNETHWKRLHREYKVIRLVPESNIALIKGRQTLTAEQIEVLNQTDYVIERY